MTENRKGVFNLVNLGEKYILCRTLFNFWKEYLCDTLNSISWWDFLRLLETHCIIFCNTAWHSRRGTTSFELSLCNMLSRQLWNERTKYHKPDCGFPVGNGKVLLLFVCLLLFSCCSRLFVGFGFCLFGFVWVCFYFVSNKQWKT